MHWAGNPIDLVDKDNDYCIWSYIVGATSIVYEMKKAASECNSYQQIKQAISTNKANYNLPPSHPAKILSNVWDRLSIMVDNFIVLDNCRLFVPSANWKKILHLLHIQHCGISKTLATACQYYHWPSLKNDVTNMINACVKCQNLRPSLPDNNEITTIVVKPMEKVSIDIFENKNKHDLLMVDWYSGFPWIYQINILSTDSITNQLLATFQTFGYPPHYMNRWRNSIPQQISNFCNNHGIIHEAASPYNPHSNAHAEVTIKILETTHHKVLS